MDRFALIASLLLAIAVGALPVAMGAPPYAVVVVVIVAFAVVYFALSSGSRARARAKQMGIGQDERAALEKYVGFYAKLDDDEKRRFEAEVAAFLAEQEIAGARGATIDAETRALVAASAVMLTFRRPGFVWPKIRDVVVYTDAFNEDYQVSATGNVLGQVHAQGAVILSARALRDGFKNAKDGHNVGLHEFAHVLDFEAGQVDGVPSLMPWRSIGPWVDVMRREMERAKNGRSVLRPYAAKNEAELLAVATEAYFERPTKLREKHPELYALLEATYGPTSS